VGSNPDDEQIFFSKINTLCIHFFENSVLIRGTSMMQSFLQLGSLETEPLSCPTTQHWCTTTCPSDVQNYL